MIYLKDQLGVASLITLLIATITVCLQALKTALSNPVKNLRSE